MPNAFLLDGAIGSGQPCAQTSRREENSIPLTAITMSGRLGSPTDSRSHYGEVSNENKTDNHPVVPGAGGHVPCSGADFKSTRAKPRYARHEGVTGAAGPHMASASGILC